VKRIEDAFRAAKRNGRAARRKGMAGPRSSPTSRRVIRTSRPRSNWYALWCEPVPMWSSLEFRSRTPLPTVPRIRGRRNVLSPPVQRSPECLRRWRSSGGISKYRSCSSPTPTRSCVTEPNVLPRMPQRPGSTECSSPMSRPRRWRPSRRSSTPTASTSSCS